MARKVREILKGYFKTGKRPTEENFEDLIDSAMNVLEDSSYHTLENGFLLTYPGFEKDEEGNHTLVSICPEPLPESEKHIKWKIGIDENENLHIQSPSNNGQDSWKSVLTINKLKGSEGNRHEVNIEGTLSCKSRKGNYKSGEINADGKWHEILEEEGCRAFEVVAGCEQKETGCYALIVATAMHCFGKGRKIRKVHSYSGSFGNRLCLRLVKVKGKPACKLQIKTFFNYGDNTKVYYRITNLWDHPTTK